MVEPGGVGNRTGSKDECILQGAVRVARANVAEPLPAGHSPRMTGFLAADFVKIITANRRAKKYIEYIRPGRRFARMKAPILP